MERKRIGIRDVASAAGVSVTTVSHILNNVPNTRVSDGTRTRVQDEARRLGYQPNRLARGLRIQRSHMIGLLSEEIATTPHAGRIILGAQDTASSHGLTLVLLNTDRDRSRVESGVNSLLHTQVDGILYATMFHRELEVPAALRGTPTVLIDASADSEIPSVVPDEVGGARAAVGELLEHGHRRIGFLNNRDDIPATHGRLRGYREALAGSGIPYDPELLVEAESESVGGYVAARHLLSLPDPPTGWFCFNDRMAMGAYRAVAEAGLRIPEDVSIVGFDDQRIISEGLFPELTTVALPHYEMGVWAVETLVSLIEGRNPFGEYPQLLACPLVRRRSVSFPARS
jgi:LacI family transcriptional regulator